MTLAFLTSSQVMNVWLVPRPHFSIARLQVTDSEGGKGSRLALVKNFSSSRPNLQRRWEMRHQSVYSFPCVASSNPPPSSPRILLYMRTYRPLRHCFICSFFPFRSPLSCVCENWLSPHPQDASLVVCSLPLSLKLERTSLCLSWPSPYVSAPNIVLGTEEEVSTYLLNEWQQHLCEFPRPEICPRCCSGALDLLSGSTVVRAMVTRANFNSNFFFPPTHFPANNLCLQLNFSFILCHRS